MAKKPSQFDLIIRHQVYLERVKAGMIKDTAKAIKAVENAVVDILKRVEVASLDELSQRQVNTLVRELKQTHLELMGGEVSRLTDELGTLADFTAAWEAASLTNLSKGALQVQAAEAGAAFKRALAQPIGDQGTLLQPFMKQLSDGTAEKLEGVVRNGWQQGSTINDMVRAIRGTRENKFRDGLTQWSTNQADALVRTAAQHVSEQARQATWATNGDIIKGYEIVATLDNRTTQICRSLDGKRFELGKGPVPPLHIRCRTTSVADLGDEFAFLREGATRSSENGYVPADQTYYDWIKTEDRSYVKDTLGPTRAKLLLDGGLTPDEFAKLGYNKQFEPLTLNEMMARNAEVFERAGVENWPGKKVLPPVVEDEVPETSKPPRIEPKAAPLPEPSRTPTYVNNPGVPLEVKPLDDRLDLNDKGWSFVSLPQADVFPDFSRVDFGGRSFAEFMTDPAYGAKIDFSRLSATQNTVNVKGVEKYVSEKPSTRNVLVYKYQGKYIVFDGHHTLEAALLRGEKSGVVTLLDLDQTAGPKMTPTNSSLTMPSKAEIKSGVSLKDLLPANSAFRNDQVAHMVATQWNNKVIPTLDGYRPKEREYILAYAKKLKEQGG